MVLLPVSGKSQSYQVNPSKIIALGLNYHSHIGECHTVKISGVTDKVPQEPLLFSKTTNVLIGPGEPIVIPAFLLDYGFEDLRTDYEAELAIVMGKRCRNVTPDEAFEHVLGYTCMNDVSQRNIQHGDRSGWFRGKSLDTFGPIGPRIVLHEEIGDPQNLHIQCRLNGVTVQDANTAQMIFPMTELIAFISKHFTLMPGDIIATGTPGGVGRIHNGDVVEIEIEKIGVLSNPVVEEWAK
ncbi:MAG: fumarylacetoacetate hydrolase family protein [Syntrophobacteraceae bacterium]|jgi:2-keto-4-pentenoate hydratase/2-oxohepta-3-ene-1,7-dioic acid hydratase in catechol pathway